MGWIVRIRAGSDRCAVITCRGAYLSHVPGDGTCINAGPGTSARIGSMRLILPASARLVLLTVRPIPAIAGSGHSCRVVATATWPARVHVPPCAIVLCHVVNSRTSSAVVCLVAGLRAAVIGPCGSADYFGQRSARGQD